MDNTNSTPRITFMESRVHLAHKKKKVQNLNFVPQILDIAQHILLMKSWNCALEC